MFLVFYPHYMTNYSLEISVEDGTVFFDTFRFVEVLWFCVCGMGQHAQTVVTRAWRKLLPLRQYKNILMALSVIVHI